MRKTVFFILIVLANSKLFAQTDTVKLAQTDTVKLVVADAQEAEKNYNEGISFLQSKTLDCSSCHDAHKNAGNDLNEYSKK